MTKENTNKNEVSEVVEVEFGNVLKLKKPVMINGEMTSEIKYDLENLSGQDVQHAINELYKRNIQVMVAEIDSNYHAMLFAISAGLSYEDISALGLKDYQKMCGLVRNFFLEE